MKRSYIEKRELENRIKWHIKNIQKQDEMAQKYYELGKRQMLELIINMPTIEIEQEEN